MKTRVLTLLICFGAAYFWLGPGVAEPQAPSFGFVPGMEALSLSCGPDDELCESSVRCGYCHAKEYEAWQGSRHRSSYTNALFQHGYAREPQKPCRLCHAPIVRPAHQANLDHEGISCLVCHMRAGTIVSDKSIGQADYRHALSKSSTIKSSEFCASCHEFNWMRPERHGAFSLTGSQMQTTYTEWLAYKKAGGTKSCQGCHMPGGSHAFKGAHDVDFLRASIRVRTEKKHTGRCYIVLESEGVGHHLPTGDVFRHMTLEVEDTAAKGKFRTIATFGRRFEFRANKDTATPERFLASDTALKPGVPARISVPCQGGSVFRVLYHYARETDESSPLLLKRIKL